MFCTKNGTKFSFWIYCCRCCRCWSPSKNPNLIKYIFAGLGSKQVVLWYLHIWLTLNHFRATRPDSHSTISIITWYLLLKILIFSTIYIHIFDSHWIIFVLLDPTWTQPYLILTVTRTRLIWYLFTPYAGWERSSSSLPSIPRRSRI